MKIFFVIFLDAEYDPVYSNLFGKWNHIQRLKTTRNDYPPYVFEKNHSLNV